MTIREHHLNSLSISKGRLAGNRFPIWDVVLQCTDDCVLREECKYDRHSQNKCKLQLHYLRSALDIILDNLPEEVPCEYKLQRIGLAVMPLYKQLITMKMLEHTLKSPEVGEGGKCKIHPVYKEIRQILKDIDLNLKDLGVNTSAAQISPTGDIIEGGKEEAIGSTGYYEEMQSIHEGQRDERNKEKKKSSNKRNLQ